MKSNEVRGVNLALPQPRLALLREQYEDDESPRFYWVKIKSVARIENDLIFFFEFEEPSPKSSDAIGISSLKNILTADGLGIIK